MNLKFGDVTKRRSPTFCDCHVKKIIFIAGSFKSQLIDYFRGHIVSWEKPLQFYAN